MDRKDKQHALLSASGAHRWLECTPSAVLEAQFPDTASTAAAEGTLAHELAELKLRHYFRTADFSKGQYARTINKLKKDALWDNEMQGYTDNYLDYIKSVAMGFPSIPYVAIEKRVDFGAYVPDGFGTADCILISAGVLHIVDFKYGKGVPVSAEHNPQLSLYALGAYEAYKIFYPITDVVLHIVQPRITGEVSSWSCTAEKLLQFGEWVKPRAALAAKGEGGFQPGEKTCRFCRAKGRCRARSEENVKLAFAAGKLPPLISNEELGRYLEQGRDVAKWLADLQELALKESLAGNEIPGWKAVEGRSFREWTDMDGAFARLRKNGVPEALLYERKPLTLAQVEKVVGKKEFNEYVGAFVEKKPGKPMLAPATDKRPAVTNKITAAKAFGLGNLK